MVALLQVAHAGAELLDDAGALVAEDGRLVTGRIGAGGGEEVRVADAAGDEPDEDFAVLRLRQVELLHLQRLPEFLEDGGAGLHAAILKRRRFMQRRIFGREDAFRVRKAALLTCASALMLGGVTAAHGTATVTPTVGYYEAHLVSVGFCVVR